MPTLKAKLADLQAQRASALNALANVDANRRALKMQRRNILVALNKIDGAITIVEELSSEKPAEAPAPAKAPEPGK